ncbi:hypothetical protein [Lactococcus hircilactis]|uniref:hypothetical protein n=1 Tax=Lactococcus hircilactis TaxID=1494462 RepID=UPI003FA232AC
MTELDNMSVLVAREVSNEIILKFNEYATQLLTLKGGQRLPYISKKEVIKELDISDGTLTTWENNGLNRYKPSYKTSLIYYLIDDVCQFITLET